MPRVNVPASLRSHVDNLQTVNAEGDTVGEVLQKLIGRYPALESALMNQQKSVHSHLNLFVGEDNIRDLQNLDTKIAADQTLLIVPALAGG